MTYPFLEDNHTSRARLEVFVNSLSEGDLNTLTHDGWSVSSLLAHMAFWDRRMVVLLRRWQADGVSETPVDADMINDAQQLLFRAIEPSAAAALCLSSAAEIDAALEAMSLELYEAIESSGVYFRFNRSLHRNGHISDIETALGRV